MATTIPYAELSTLRRAKELGALDSHRNDVVNARRARLQERANEEHLANYRRTKAREELAEALLHSESASEGSIRAARKCGRM